MLNALDAHAWAELEIAAEPCLLGHLIQSTTRGFLCGQTGVGKSMLLHGMAGGMASGEGFLHWRSDRASRVLVVDGEMPSLLIKQRLHDMLRRAAPIEPGMLTLYSPDRAEDFAAMMPELGKLEPLNTDAGQEFVVALVEMIKPDVVIFDNVMSLTPGVQKEEEAFAGAMPLVRWLSQRRIGQVWGDHMGRAGGHQYGPTTKSWTFDTNGMLDPLLGEKRAPQELAFTLSFEPPHGKARRRTPENWRDFETVIIRLKDDRWTGEPVDPLAAAQAADVPPSRVPFYDALVAAVGKSSLGAGQTTLDAWQDECLRRGLVEKPPPDKETWQERGARFRLFRTAKSDLLAARCIAIQDDVVTDLKGRW